MAEFTLQAKREAANQTMQRQARSRLQDYRQSSASSAQRQALKPAQPDPGLPGQLKAGVESLSGMRMDHVKVHYNSSAPAQLNAHAYAQGSDIHLAPGQEKHLPHEAWHVVQQAQGRVKSTTQMKRLHGHRDAPAQLKKSKPDDAILTGLIGNVVDSTVGASAVGEADKATAVWAVLDKSYEDNKSKGAGLMTELSAKIDAYKDIATKQAVIDTNSLKDTANAGKFNDNYSHTATHIAGTNYRVNTDGYDPATTTKPTVDPGENEGAYSNEFDVTSGKIKAAWNFAEFDDARKSNKGINNSEILWNQHKEAAKKHHTLDSDKDAKVNAAMKGISKIVRSTVINKDTKSTVYMAYPNGEKWTTADKSWTPGNDDFNAILGTPNARSTPFLLIDHMHELEKTIDKIETKGSSDMEIDFKAIP